MRVPAICPLLSCWPVPSSVLLIPLACTHACTLRRRIAIPALACSSALHSYWHARAGAAAAVQLLRSHTPQPAHGALAIFITFPHNYDYVSSCHGPNRTVSLLRVTVVRLQKILEVIKNKRSSPPDFIQLLHVLDQAAQSVATSVCYQ